LQFFFCPGAWQHLITVERDTIKVQHMVTVISRRIMPVKAMAADGGTTAVATDTDTMAIAPLPGNMDISVAGIATLAGDIGAAAIRVAIAADITTADEKNVSGCNRKSVSIALSSRI
jgi:hypothetical protein